MVLEHRPETGETEWSDGRDVAEEAVKTSHVDPAPVPPSADSAGALTLQEAACHPPELTVVEVGVPTDVTVWISVSQGQAGPVDPTLGGPPEAFPGLAKPAAIPEIAGYELIAELGRGSMGVVYKAREIGLKRYCAIKMMLSGTRKDLPIAQRFKGEAESLALLSHPNIVQIYAIGESGELPYLALEFVEGGSLAERLDGTPSPPEEAARLIAALARGVAEIHRRGLVHRDLKPGNILIAADGTPKVADFGLVKVRTSEETLTPSGSILGSPSYMAPEQANGWSDVGPAADVYGLGAILYELLTGRPPFRGATIRQTINQVIAGDPVPPSKLTPGLPRDIETICLKCLMKDAVDRYKSADDLAEDLRRYLAKETILAQPVSIWERGVKWARRRPGAAVLVVALASSLIGLLSLWGWSYAEIARHLQLAETARAEAETARGEAVAETYRARLSETRAFEIARPAGWRDASIRNLDLLGRMDTPMSDRVELRSAAMATLGGIDVRERARFDVGNGVRSIDFSPDSASLATADYGGRLRIFDLKSLEHQTVLDDPACNFVQYAEDAPTPAVRYRPGGGGLVYATFDGCVDWYDPAHPGAKRRCFRGRSQPCSVSFDASGRRLAVSWTDGWVTLLDADTGAVLRSIVTGASWHTNPVALSPDGKWIATIGPDSRVDLYPTDSSGGPITLGRHLDLVRSLVFSGDGLSLASASIDETVKVWDMRRRDERLTLRGHSSRVNGVAFHPDGDLIASAGDDNTVRLWDAKTGAALLLIRPEVGSVLALAFSPDGESLACGHDVVCLYALTGLHQRKRLRGLPHEIFGTAFHPREPHLVVSGASNQDINAFDLDRSRLVRRWRAEPTGLAPLGALAVSPIGRIVATASSKFMGIGVNPDFAVRLWRIDDGTLARSLEGQDSPVDVLAFDAEGSRLASGASDGRLIVWGVASGKRVFEIHRGDQAIVSIRFIDGGRRLVVGGDGGRIDVINLGEGSTSASTTIEGGIARFAVAPNEDRLLVGGNEGDLVLVSLPDLKSIRRVLSAQRGKIPGVAFSPDGTMVVTGGRDRLVILRDAKSLDPILTLPVYDGEIYQIAISSDGAYLAVAGVEQRLDVWNLARIEPALARIGLSWRAPESSNAVASLPAIPSPKRIDHTPSRIDRAWADMGLGEEFRNDLSRAPEVIAAYRRAIVIWEELIAEYPDRAFCASEMAVSYAARAVFEYESGRSDDASRSIGRALAIVGPLRGTDARIDLARARVESLASICEPDKQATHLDRAIAALRSALAGGYKDRKQLDTNPDLNPLRDRDDFRALVRADYPRFGWPYLLNRGRSRTLQGRFDKAIVDLEDARKALRPLVEAEPNDTWLRKNWASSTIDLAALHLATEAGLPRSVGLREAIATLEPMAEVEPGLVTTLARAQALLAAEDPDGDHAAQAMTALRRALAAGVVDLDFIDRDPALQTLANRADFKALVADLAFPRDPFAK